jgi:hypothetical protein
MGYSAVKFPVKCPICGGEVLFEQSLSAIVDAWLHDQAIRLTSRCHGARWNSTDVERNQIFEYAEGYLCEDRQIAFRTSYLPHQSR